MEITRTFDLLDRYRKNFDKPDAFVYKTKGVWEKVSSKEYIEDSHLFAYGLLAKEIKKGDKIVIITNNRPAWNIVDMGTAMAGVVNVPVFNSFGEKEFEFILEHSDAKIVIVADLNAYETIRALNEKIEIFSFEQIDGVPNWKEIIELGRKNEKKYNEELQKIKESVKEDDFATLLYTSGTTGTPKGVMLSHKNLVHNFLAASKIFNLKSDYKYLNILPLFHVGGRMGNYQTQYSGCSIYYAENMGTIAKNMKEIQPDGFDAVPRILEKIYDTIIAKGKNLKGIKKMIFFWAVKIGLKYRISGFGLGFYNFKLKIADKLIFSKWREAIGGKVKIVGCGGATLQPRLEKIFWAAGIKILNMYGLTETSPIISINRTTKPDVKLATVGPLIDGVQVKIAKDGEILCKGHNVMLGYYKNQELTDSVLDEDGWFHTGDIGFMDEDKFLKVTDRKKEIFKLSNGKYIAPQVIENKFKESVFIDQIMVVGEHKKFASALISPNFDYVNKWCDKKNISYNNRQEMIKLPDVINVFNSEIKKLNKHLSSPEKISRFKLVPDEWSPFSGELSPTLKLKRKFIDKKYELLLQEVYVNKNV